MIFTREETELEGVYKVHLENFSDNRGQIVNLFDKEQFSTFKVDKLSKSRQNVLRGLHGDTANDKLIYCLQGRIHSQKFLKWALLYIRNVSVLL